MSGDVQNISAGVQTAADIRMGRDNCDYHGQVYPFLDLPDDLVGGRSIEHHAVGTLVLRLHRQPDSPGTGGDSAAHTHKDRHIGHSDNCLLYTSPSPRD